VEHSAGRGRKRACKGSDYKAGNLDVCSSVVVVAGARVTLVKKINAQM
jgi:hypothetical protein